MDGFYYLSSYQLFNLFFELFFSSLAFSDYSFALHVIITIVLLVVSQEKASPVDVFGKGGYVNMSGLESNAANFFTGLLGVNWGFSCLDGCVHLSEESNITPPTFSFLMILELIDL